MHHCSYKTISDTPEGTREICTECKRVNTFRKDPRNGRIDNRKYLKEHQRDTAQPFGKTGKIFRKYYGDEAQYISRFKG